MEQIAKRVEQVEMSQQTQKSKSQLNLNSDTQNIDGPRNSAQVDEGQFKVPYQTQFASSKSVVASAVPESQDRIDLTKGMPASA